MKVLKSGIDFKHAYGIEPKLGDSFLIKRSVATGWAYLAKVFRITPTQIELEIINVIPTEDTNKLGVKNGLTDRQVGFFQHWAEYKRNMTGKRYKFSKENGMRVGSSKEWNPLILCELINH
jgi:hypothetical protein